MPNRPNILRDRVVRAAIEVSNCVAEFGNGNPPVGTEGLEFCSEHFENLHNAVADLYQFNNNVFLVQGYLDQIQAISDVYGQPDRSRLIKGFIQDINDILNAWKEETDAG